jgi:hypothetical protein
MPIEDVVSAKTCTKSEADVAIFAGEVKKL